MIWEKAFLKIYLWPISVLIIHNISFITLICFIILPIYSATVDYFQLIVPLLATIFWRDVLTCFVAKVASMVSTHDVAIHYFGRFCIQCVIICTLVSAMLLQSAMIPSVYLSWIQQLNSYRLNCQALARVYFSHPESLSYTHITLIILQS